MNPSMRFNEVSRFAVDVQKAKKELKELRRILFKTREEILELEHLDFAIGEMKMFGKCSIFVLSQYKLMTPKELKEFVIKFSKKGVFMGIK
jgi:hypothetical protein